MLNKTNINLANKIVGFLKYSLVGLVRAVFTFSLYTVLIFKGLSPLISLSVVFAIALPIAILTQKKFVFRHNDGFNKTIPVYLLLSVIMYLFNMCMLYFLTTALLINAVIAQMVCVFCITIINYTFLSSWFQKQAELS